MEDLTSRAAELASLMTAWLTDPRTASLMADPDRVPASLIEWCRSARDVLALIVPAEQVTYTCGTPIAHRAGQCTCVTGAGHLPAPGYSAAELAAAARTDPWAH